MAKSGEWIPWFGEWLSSMVLCPIGIFLTYKANKDSAVFNIEAYINVIRKILGLRISRHIARKEVIIHDPDYPVVKTELTALSQEWQAYAQKSRLRLPPNYLHIFFHNIDDHEVISLSRKMENLITILSNSRDAAILDALNKLPIVPTHAHTRPFHNYKWNMVLGIIFPVGIFFYFRIWRYRLRLYKDIQQIKKIQRVYRQTNREDIRNRIKHHKVMDTFKLNTIEEAIADFKEGKFIIVVDDEDRENEGDFITAAEMITPEKVNFMLQEGRGVLCAPITISRSEELDLPHQVSTNTSILGTPFTITIDKLEGCTTGVSAHDRAATIRALADPSSRPETFGRPGHINPLYAQDKGVLRRAGHTEAAVDLARLAGLQPAAALIEILNPDGTMARMPELQKVSARFGIKIIAIRDLIAYRLKQESMVERGPEVDMPTDYGHFRDITFRQISNGLEHVALIKGEWEPDEPI